MANPCEFMYAFRVGARTLCNLARPRCACPHASPQHVACFVSQSTACRVLSLCHSAALPLAPPVFLPRRLSASLPLSAFPCAPLCLSLPLSLPLSASVISAFSRQPTRAATTAAALMAYF